VTEVAHSVKSGVPITITRVSKVFGEETEKPFQALKVVCVEIDA
jgi:NitT/TauT family transport system ATP-binding protein